MGISVGEPLPVPVHAVAVANHMEYKSKVFIPLPVISIEYPNSLSIE